MKKFYKALSIILSAAMMLTAMCITSSAASTNLITNGTASGGMNGWTDPDGLWQTDTDYDGVKAYDSYYFHPKGYKGSNGTRIYQDVNVKSYVGMKATLSAQNRAYGSGNDESMLKIEFFNSSGNLIDASSSEKDTGSTTWHIISVSATVPNNAVTARVSLYSFYKSGSEADSYFDNVSLTMNGSASGTDPNLVTNANASNGIKGWTDPDGLWQTDTNYDGVGAYDSYYFHPKGYKGSNGTRIYQDINVKGYVGMTATLSAQNRAYGSGNDESMLKIEFFNSSGKLLDSASSVKDPGSTKWHLISVSVKVPNNAVTARISLYSFYKSGSEADSYFDNISFTMSGTKSGSSSNSALSHIRIDLSKGSALQLSGVLSDSSTGNVTWASSNSSVASVSSSGKVTAKEYGTAIISAKYGSTTLKIEVNVT